MENIKGADFVQLRREQLCPRQRSEDNESSEGRKRQPRLRDGDGGDGDKMVGKRDGGELGDGGERDGERWWGNEMGRGYGGGRVG